MSRIQNSEGNTDKDLFRSKNKSKLVKSASFEKTINLYIETLLFKTKKGRDNQNRFSIDLEYHCLALKLKRLFS